MLKKWKAEMKGGNNAENYTYSAVLRMSHKNARTCEITDKPEN